jgi:hypothetical protein
LGAVGTSWGNKSITSPSWGASIYGFVSGNYRGWYPQLEAQSVSIYRVIRYDGQPDTGGDPPGTNCRCSEDSCRVNCAIAPDGFCCIDHSLTDRLLQVLQN